MHEAHEWDLEHDDQIIQLLLQSALTMNLLRLNQKGYEWHQDSSDAIKEAPGSKLWMTNSEEIQNITGTESQNLAIKMQGFIARLTRTAIQESAIPNKYFKCKPADIRTVDYEMLYEIHHRECCGEG